MRRMIGPSLVGVFGVVILITLGLWQMQRMGWKEAKLAAISAMLVDAPVDLPVQATSEADRYRGVMIEGAYTGEVALKLDSLQGQGPGKRVIAVFATQDGRRVLVDRGIWLDGTEASPRLRRPLPILPKCWATLIGRKRLTAIPRRLTQRRACGLPAMCPPWPRPWAQSPHLLSRAHPPVTELHQCRWTPRLFPTTIGNMP